jgi:hydroxymethylpyrimidine pyrophosphatase-like HAD family hydrolase
MYMDNVKIRAVVLDVDGTLTDENKVISLEILSVLRKLDKNGIKIIFATGNVMPVIYGI